MDAAVHRTHRVLGVIAFHAEVHPLGLDVPLGYKQGVVDELIDALIFGGGNGDYRNAQNLLQLIDTDGAAVGPDLIHHVQRQHHRYPQLEQLKRQVQIALNVGGVHNVDHAVRLLIEDKIAGDDLLLRIRTQGVDARQVDDGAALLVAHLAHLLVDGHARKVAHVLVGTGEGVEQRRLAAVLVADKRKDHADTPSTSIFFASSTRSVNS